MLPLTTCPKATQRGIVILVYSFRGLSSLLLPVPRLSLLLWECVAILLHCNYPESRDGNMDSGAGVLAHKGYLVSYLCQTIPPTFLPPSLSLPSILHLFCLPIAPRLKIRAQAGICTFKALVWRGISDLNHTNGH